MKRLLRALYGVAALTVAAASAHAADDWLNLATVSMTDATTPKLANRYVCYTDGTDIACNAPSLYVSTGGLVGINTSNPNAQLDVNGTISATNFVGNGAGLTGVVAASGDRIVSGTTSMVADGASGFVSLTQSAVNTGWFDPQKGFVTIGVSSTGPISGTSGYFSGNVGIGTLPNSSYALSTSGSLTFSNGNVLMDSNRGLIYTGNSNIGFKAPGNSPSIVNGSPAIPAFFAGNTGFNGIGTSATQATLQVSGTFTVSNSGQTTTPSLYVASGGRVGIGTASPASAAKLDVNGKLYLKGVTFADSDGTSNYISAPSNGYLYFYPSNTLSHVMTADGKVGIGTVTPAASLTVVGEVQVSNSGLSCSNAATGAIRYTSGTGVQYCDSAAWTTLASGGAGGAVTGSGSATAVAFWNGTSSLTYDSTAGSGFYYDAANHRLGVGTDSPTSTVEISPTAGNGNALRLVYADLRNDMSANQISTYNSPLYIQYGSTSNTLINATGGLVGIGTGTPSTTLDILSTGSAVARVQTTAANSYAVNRFSTPARTIEWALAGAGASNADAFYLYDTTSATTRLLVDHNGNVGIGTTAPSEMLDVVNGAGAAIRLQGGGFDRDKWRFTVSDSNSVGIFQLQDYSGGTYTTDITVDHLGKVAIGTLSPTAKLDVQGTISASDAIQVGASSLGCSAGIPGAIRYNSGVLEYCNGAAWTTLASGAGVTGTGSATAVAFWNGSSGLTYDSDGFYWDATNNRLGIGTNAPSNKFDVFNNSSAGSGADNAGMAITSVNRNAYAVLDSGNNWASTLYFYNSGVAKGSIQYFNSGGTYPDSMLFTVSGTEKMRIASSGNLGIATQSPTATLQVSGTFTVSNSAQVTTPTLYADGNGNVGVGTSAPAAALHVETTSGAPSVILNRSYSNTLDASAQFGGAHALGSLGSPAAVVTDTQLLNIAGLGYDGSNFVTGATITMYADEPFTGSARGTSIHFGTRGLGSTTPSERMRITANGNVGIGTATPNVSLTVNGAAALGDTTHRIYIGGTGGMQATTDRGCWIGFDNGGSGVLGIQGEHGGTGYKNLALNPNGGSVGIGTTTPWNLLTLVNASQPGSNANAGGGAFTISSGGGANTDEQLLLGVHTGDYSWIQAVKPGTSQRMLALNPNGGNVGVGTTTPSATLSVLGEVQVSSTGLTCNNAATGAIRYTSGTGVQYCNSAVWTTLASGAGVTGTGSATAVAFWNSSAGLTYDAGLYWDNSNKRLGVGTTTPTQAFEVSGSLRISKSNGSPVAVIKIPEATALGQFSVNDETGYQSYYGFIGSNAGQGARNSTTEVGSRNTDITLRPGETETMRLTTAGKVGIGTTNPGKKLDVQDSAAGSSVVSRIYHSDNTSGASHAYLDIQEGGSNGGDPFINFGLQGETSWQVGVDNSDTNKFKIGNNASTYDSAGVGSNTYLTIDQAGHVGIGTATPQAVLHIDSASTFVRISGNSAGLDNGLEIAPTATGGHTWRLQAADPTRGGIGNAFNITDVTAGAQRLAIDQSGSVGIGTTSPNVSLTVIGEVQVSNSGATCSNARTGAIRYTSGTGVQYCNSAAWTTLASGAGVTGTGSATAVAYWNGSSGLTYDSDGFYWDAANNRLGIGTNAPGYALEISTAGVSGIIISNTTTGSANASSLNLSRGDQANGYAGLTYLTGGTNDWVLNVPAGTRDLRLWDYGWSPGGTNKELMRFTTSGTVGIAMLGGTSPTATLQVSGTFTVSNSAQTTTPSLIVASNAKVGVGTDTPSETLHVYGAIKVGGVSATAMSANNGASGGIDYCCSSAGGVRFFSWGQSGTSTRGTYQFISKGGDGTGQIFPVTIDTSGNVGIGGQTAPQAALQVSGTFIVSNSAQVTTPSIYVQSTGRVGIGNTTPGDALDIRGANANIDTNLGGQLGIRLTNTDATSGNYMSILNYNSGNVVNSGIYFKNVDQTNEGRIDFVTRNAGGWGQRVVIAGNGNVGLGGQTNPQAALDVSGSIFHSGILTDLSDRRMKQNIQVLPSTLQKVLSLLPVSYQKKATPDLTEYGFIAQDVLPTFPNLVTTANDSSRTMSLNYIGLIAPLVKAVQEVEARRQLDVFATAARLKVLEAANDNLRLQLKAANDNYIELKREVEGTRRARGRR